MLGIDRRATRTINRGEEEKRGNGRRMAVADGRMGTGSSAVCLPAKLHLHNSYAAGYRSVSSVPSSHQRRASRARPHARGHGRMHKN